jgi:hypothetical protein
MTYSFLRKLPGTAFGLLTAAVTVVLLASGLHYTPQVMLETETVTNGPRLNNHKRVCHETMDFIRVPGFPVRFASSRSGTPP